MYIWCCTMVLKSEDALHQVAKKKKKKKRETLHQQLGFRCKAIKGDQEKRKHQRSV